jgi:hypothetical protein
LREDGPGRRYQHPGLDTADTPAEGDYFRIPYAYWNADIQDWADLPTKAVLLIALSLQDDFLLPLDQGSRWYGLSKDSVRTGLRGLMTRRFLTVRTRRKPAPLTAAGFTTERRFTLAGPFAHSAQSVTPDGSHARTGSP